jgi:hypothetical protein
MSNKVANACAGAETGRTPTAMRRSRALYFALVALTIPLGLAARRFDSRLPDVIGKYAPDALWAVMVFFAIALCWPAWRTGKVAGAALLFSFIIEFSQLYHAPWIDAIRATTLGGLVLGFGFLVSDLVCYCIGIAIAGAIDHLILSRSLKRPATG